MKKTDGPMESFQIRFPKTLRADIEEFATRDQRSVAGLIRKICEDYVRTQREKEPR